MPHPMIWKLSSFSTMTSGEESSSVGEPFANIREIRMSSSHTHHHETADSSDLSQAGQLVDRETELPTGMGEAVRDRATRVVGEIGSVHRLQREMTKAQMLEAFRLRLGLALWIHQLQLITRGHAERGVGLRAHAEPIDSRRRELRAVGLDGDLEPFRVKRVNERGVELKQRFASRADDEGRRGREEAGAYKR